MLPVAWVDVASTNVRRVAWAYESGEGNGHPMDDVGSLYVQFRGQGNATYVYEDVPRRIYDQLLAAPSKGGYVHQVIKRFPARKVELDDEQPLPDPTEPT